MTPKPTMWTHDCPGPDGEWCIVEMTADGGPCAFCGAVPDDGEPQQEPERKEPSP